MVVWSSDECHQQLPVRIRLQQQLCLSVTTTISVATWSVPGAPAGLSVTSVGNVLVAMGNGMKEYTSGGALVRTVTNGNSVWHAVEVNKDIWAFTMRGPMSGICTTLTNGTLIKCYGSAAGPGIMQMNLPGHLAVDTCGYIIVADWGNNRILTVDPSLAEARQLLWFPLDTALTIPMALSLDESRALLYIGEDGNRQRIMVFSVVW